MGLRKNYISSPIETIYLGGGTPSQLREGNLNKIFEYISNTFDIDSHAEITMECNPDDITEAYSTCIQRLPINRVSMGAQTFDDKRLKFLHRRHTAAQIAKAVSILRGIGIGNLSIDLMYGFPEESVEEWEKDIDKALHLNVEHISAYCLMYEEGTPLYRMLQKKEVSEVDEEISRLMYEKLIDRLTTAGYQHYEISNFSHNGYQSRHNSSYWKQIPYIGIGASAHSFDGGSRQWNIDDMNAYISHIHQGVCPYKREVLDTNTRYNDTVFTALRTSEGVDLNMLETTFGKERARYCLNMAKPHIDNGRLCIDKHHLRLTRQGIYVSDDIMSDLMIV